MTADTWARTGNLWRWAVGLLLIVHGLIHLMGPIEIWEIADIEELSGRASLSIGPTATSVLAALWLVAMLILISSGWALLTRRDWWRVTAIVGVVVSQFVIILWWDDAATGTIPNVLIMTAVVLSRRIGLTPHGS